MGQNGNSVLVQQFGSLGLPLLNTIWEKGCVLLWAYTEWHTGEIGPFPLFHAILNF